jgi:hypothetical protein
MRAVALRVGDQPLQWLGQGGTLTLAPPKTPIAHACAPINGPDYHEAAHKLIEAAPGRVIDPDEIVAALQPASAV